MTLDRFLPAWLLLLALLSACAGDGGASGRRADAAADAVADAALLPDSGAAVHADALGDAGPDVGVRPDGAEADDSATGADALPDAAADIAPADAAADAADAAAPCVEFACWQPPATAATRLRWSVMARPRALPWPSDHYLVPDETSRSGQRVCSDDDRCSNRIVDPMFRFLASHREALKTLEGFGAYGYASIEVVGAAPFGWEQAPADALPADAPVRMFLWRPGEALLPVAFRARVSSGLDEAGQPVGFLDLLPLRPLPDGGRVIVAVTRGFLDADGAAVGPDAEFQVALGLVETPPWWAAAEVGGDLDAVVAALEGAGYGREELAVAFVYTVAPVRAALLDIGRRFAEDEALRRPASAFDVDEDGAEDIFLPGDAGFPGVSDVQLFARGRFERRDFRHDDDFGGTFVLDAEGHPIESGRGPLSFYLALPAGGGGPYPAALLLHGIDSTKDSMRSLASMLAGAGFAVLAIDLPNHGDDGSGAVAFLEITDPLGGRDNWRQAAVDIQTARGLLERWDAEDLDLVPAPGGDGVGDIDASRVVLVGHSLGAMTGSMAMAIGQQPEAGVLTVGGGGLMYFIRSFLDRYGFTALLPAHLIHSVEVLIGHVLAEGDPVVYAELLRHTPPAWVERPHQAILMEVLGDETMPEACLEAHAAAMRLPIVGPVLKEVAGVAPTDEDAPSAGLVQYDGPGHQLMFGDGQSAVARAQAVHFLETFRDSGAAEILHPYPVPR